MFTYTGTITDIHGLTHTNPVFVVQSMNSQCSEDTSVSFIFHDDKYETSEHKNHYANYTIAYWPNIEAKDSGKRPIVFSDGNNAQNFGFSPEAGYTDTQSALAGVEQHFLNEVLPPFIVES